VGRFLKKYSDIKFHENQYGGNQVSFSCRHEDRWKGGTTRVMKLTAAFCNFAYVLKNYNSFLKK